jgi:hypothetical protein
MKIHLHSKQGIYTVATYGRMTITLTTKHKMFQVPASDFKAFAGGDWNYDVSKEEMDTFLSVVQPETYKKQLELDNQILSIAKMLDEPISFLEEDDDDTTKEQYRDWYQSEQREHTRLKNKIRSIAHQVYSQTPDFSNFQNHNGIKFIIQKHYKEDNYRFCWDPYGFVSNGHSNISDIYNIDDYCTINGGWIKIIGNNVILYYKSGDYGVYDDAIAMECAQKLFPTKKIHSFAGRVWDDALNDTFDPLPF